MTDCSFPISSMTIQSADLVAWFGDSKIYEIIPEKKGGGFTVYKNGRYITSGALSTCQKFIYANANLVKKSPDWVDWTEPIYPIGKSFDYDQWLGE